MGVLVIRALLFGGSVVSWNLPYSWAHALDEVGQLIRRVTQNVAVSDVQLRSPCGVQLMPTRTTWTPQACTILDLWAVFDGLGPGRSVYVLRDWW